MVAFIDVLLYLIKCICSIYIGDMVIINLKCYCIIWSLIERYGHILDTYSLCIDALRSIRK